MLRQIRRLGEMRWNEPVKVLELASCTSKLDVSNDEIDIVALTVLLFESRLYL